MDNSLKIGQYILEVLNDNKELITSKGWKYYVYDYDINYFIFEIDITEN